MSAWQSTDNNDIPPSSFKKSRAPLWIVLALVVLGGVGAGLWLYFDKGRGPVPTVVVDAGVPSAPQEVDAGPPLSVADGESKLRERLAALTPSAEIQRWMNSEDFLRRVTNAVNLVADGESPRPMLTFLEIGGTFEVDEKESPNAKKSRRVKRSTAKRGKRHVPPPAPQGRLFIAPESYSRYDAFTQAVTSVDARTAGKIYAELNGYFQAAYAEVGLPKTLFEARLAQALKLLIATPVLEGEVELVPKGAIYAFKDESLEKRSAAEKHLLRMGPANVKALQSAMREFAEAAGIAL